MGCEVCVPQERGYTVYFSEKQNPEQLIRYFRHFSVNEWECIHERIFWVKEAIFFDLLDYVEDHMSNNEIYAILSDIRDPLKQMHSMKPIYQFKEQRETSWIDELIKNEDICTFYQPIVGFENEKLAIKGYELLSRGLDHNGKIIPPFKMFEAARIRGRTFALDRACRLKSVKNAGIVGDKLIFINFIPTAIYAPEHCLATTFKLIKELDIKPEQVVFEVVETEEVNDIEHLKSILNYYRSHGFKYALDDVGSGYNGIEKLSKMESDFVKLAIEFTNGVSQDASKQQVAQSVLSIAHRMGSKALAEGIECEEDLLFLADMGYDLFQGYFLGKPAAKPVTNIEGLTISRNATSIAK